MVTITQVVQHAIRVHADRIFSIKVGARKTKKESKIIYTSPDGKTVTESRIPSYTPSKVETEKVVETISPKHPDWRRYQDEKRQVSALLTARVLLKLSDDAVPDSEQIELLLGPQSLRPYTANAQRIFCHAGKNPKSHVRAAHRYLRKLDNRLTKHPEKFVDTETWVKLSEHFKEVSENAKTA